MTTTTSPITAAEERAAVWASRVQRVLTGEVKLDHAMVEGLDREDALALGEAMGDAVRRATTSMAVVAYAEQVRSEVELGPNGLARSVGYASARALVASQTGSTNAEAARLIEAGRALVEARDAARAEVERFAAPQVPRGGGAADADGSEPGLDLGDTDVLETPRDVEDAPGRSPDVRVRPSDEPAQDPVHFPYVAQALDAGDLSSPASFAITRMLRRVWSLCDRDRLRAAEKALVNVATRLTYDSLLKAVLRWECSLDPQGVEERAQAQRDRRYCVIKEEHDGMIRVDARLEPEGGFALKAVLDAMVEQHFRTRRRNLDHAKETGLPAVLDERTPGQVRADAFGDFARHMQGCDVDVLPHHSVKLVVRIDYDPLTRALSDAGVIDGADGTIDAGTARRMAARAGIIPAILGTESEPLDLGRERYFSDAQKKALAERDRGCAKCGVPPSWCDAHHIIPWSLGGRTVLPNGVLLCVRCHHEIHARRWGIIATRTSVTFIPPVEVDPLQRPIPGARDLYGDPDKTFAALRAQAAATDEVLTSVTDTVRTSVPDMHADNTANPATEVRRVDASGGSRRRKGRREDSACRMSEGAGARCVSRRIERDGLDEDGALEGGRDSRATASSQESPSARPADDPHESASRSTSARPRETGLSSRCSAMGLRAVMDGSGSHRRLGTHVRCGRQETTTRRFPLPPHPQTGPDPSVRGPRSPPAPPLSTVSTAQAQRRPTGRAGSRPGSRARRRAPLRRWRRHRNPVRR